MFWQGMHNKLFLRLPSFNYIYFMAKLFSIALPTDKLFQALESSKPVNILLVVFGRFPFYSDSSKHSDLLSVEFQCKYK